MTDNTPIDNPLVEEEDNGDDGRRRRRRIVMKEDRQLILGYWNIRGLAAPIRMLLHYVHVPFQEKRYELKGEPGAWDRSEWTSVKDKLGLTFPNLPYLIDGQVQMTQSNAILRYIASQHDLIGNGVVEQAQVLEVQDVAMDFRNAMVQLFYGPHFEKNKVHFLQNTLPKYLTLFEDCLHKRMWFGGDTLSYVDFILFELLDQCRRLDPRLDWKGQHTGLYRFLTRMGQLPDLQGYLHSSDHTTLPLNNKSAAFT